MKSTKVWAICASTVALAAATAAAGTSSALAVASPTAAPTAVPTVSPTAAPTTSPTATPTGSPTPAPPTQPVTAPLPAGWFSGFQADPSAVPVKRAVSNSSYCTAGFAVTKGAVTYALGTNHCREWTNKRGRGLGKFASPVNVVSDLNPAGQSVWAAKLFCGHGDQRCLRPKSAKLPNDLLAWAPDAGTVTPVPQVMTRHGLEPVLGTGKWKKGKFACRMGAQTQKEQCGTIGSLNPERGFVYIKDADQAVALAGDSGGPVYSYVKDKAGHVLGVKALGILEQSSRHRSYFYPIATIERALRVHLVTAAPNAAPAPIPHPITPGSEHTSRQSTTS